MNDFDNRTERWNGVCTHKHCDTSLNQKSVPCPYHDAIAFCLFCSQFLYNDIDLINHTKNSKYVLMLKPLTKEEYEG